MGGIDTGVRVLLLHIAIVTSHPRPSKMIQLYMYIGENAGHHSVVHVHR